AAALSVYVAHVAGTHAPSPTLAVKARATRASAFSQAGGCTLCRVDMPTLARALSAAPPLQLPLSTGYLKVARRQMWVTALCASTEIAGVNTTRERFGLDRQASATRLLEGDQLVDRFLARKLRAATKFSASPHLRLLHAELSRKTFAYGGKAVIEALRALLQ